MDFFKKGVKKNATTKKARLIEDILQAVKCGTAPITGDFVFMLAFRTESELIEIANEFHINTNIS